MGLLSFFEPDHFPAANEKRQELGIPDSARIGTAPQIRWSHSEQAWQAGATVVPLPGGTPITWTRQDADNEARTWLTKYAAEEKRFSLAHDAASVEQVKDTAVEAARDVGRTAGEVAAAGVGAAVDGTGNRLAVYAVLGIVAVGVVAWALTAGAKVAGK